MEKESLNNKLKEVADKFNQLKTMLEEKNNEVTQIKEELNRLQGEYRLLDSLIKEPPKAPTEEDKKAVKEALDAKEAIEPEVVEN